VLLGIVLSLPKDADLIKKMTQARGSITDWVFGVIENCATGDGGQGSCHFRLVKRENRTLT